MLRVQEISSEMWTPRNIRLETRSTSCFVDSDVRVPPLVVHDDLLGLLGVNDEVIVSAPGCQVLDFLPVVHLIVQHTSLWDTSVQY